MENAIGKVGNRREQKQAVRMVQREGEEILFQEQQSWQASSSESIYFAYQRNTRQVNPPLRYRSLRRRSVIWRERDRKI